MKTVLRQQNHGIAIRLLNPAGDIVARVINPEYVDDGKGGNGDPNGQWNDGLTSGQYANLFCAAPELLAALEDLIFATAKVNTPLANAARQTALSIVTKAKGEL